MSFTPAKWLLFSASGVLAWMIASALGNRPSVATVPERSDSSVSLPAEDLAILAKPASRVAKASESPGVDTGDQTGVLDLAVRQEPRTPVVPGDDKKEATSSSASSSARPGIVSKAAVGTDHELHQAQQALSTKPKREAVDQSRPLAKDGLGRVQLSWDVLASTVLDDEFRARFPANLQSADEATVTMTGFMSPLDQVGMMNAFLLLEYPVGCFYCQTPDPAGMVYIELVAGKQAPMSYSPVRITGTLHLNSEDPEDFLFYLSDAELSLAD